MTLKVLTHEAALRALGIIPREPTPVPLEERPEDELTPEELRELVRRFKVFLLITISKRLIADTCRNERRWQAKSKKSRVSNAGELQQLRTTAMRLMTSRSMTHATKGAAIDKRRT